MSVKVKAKCIKCNFKKDSYRIFAWSPIDICEGIELSNYFTFSSKGEDAYIDEGKEYELEVEVISNNEKFGSTVKILNVLNLEEIDFTKISIEDKKEILMNCTSSEKIANNILGAYPNFIELILTKGKSAIDLKKIKGVGEAYLNSYSRTLLDKYKYFGTVQKYKDYSVSLSDAKKLHEYYLSENEIEVEFKENPYRALIQCLERKFEKADKTIINVRPDLEESKERCEYLILSVLEKSEEDGDTYLDANDLYYYIINEYTLAKKLEPFIVPCVKESELFFYDEETKRIAIANTYNGECMIKDLINEKVNNPHKLNIDWTKYTNVDGFQLTEEQSMLLKNFCDYDIACLIGKAGSGKTSIVKALVKLMEDNDLSYTLLAPTGASALRISEQTHKNASTIHRKCLMDKEIDSDVIVLDEFGMVSLDVFVMLLKCITNKKCKIVLCGDPYQLPSIGKGCVFSDIINSNKVPMAELTKVFRYDSNGGAFVGENVRQGKPFLNDNRVSHNGNKYTIGKDYKFVQTDDIFKEVLDEYSNLRKKYKEDEIIILSPFNVGDCGSYKLNEAIETEYNPQKPSEKIMSYKKDKTNIVFKVNSRVVNTKNDYKALPLDSYLEIQNSDGKLTEEDVETTQLFNGQIGVVRQVEDDYLVCQFGEEYIVMVKDKIENLLLARAISTHRSQGGEWKAVINVVSPKHTKLLSKQLLYVADTRMKEYQCDIGDRDTFEKSLIVDVVASRNTWLKDLLENSLTNAE